MSPKKKELAIGSRETSSSQSQQKRTRFDHLNAELLRAHAHHQKGQYELARRGYERILQIDHRHPDALHLLGTLALATGDYQQAERYIRAAIAVKDKEPIFFNNLGTTLLHQGSPREAITYFYRSLSLNPDYAAAHLNLGTALKEVGALSEAAMHFTRSLQLAPDSAEAYYNLGTVFQDQAKLNEAVAAYQKALQLKPDFKEAQSNFLFSINYLPELTSEQISFLHKSWGRNRSARKSKRDDHGADKAGGGKRLKIGYVSPDFRHHSVAFFALPFIEHHDRERFEVFLYSDVHRPDSVTGAFQSFADTWQSIEGMSNDQAARLIEKDNIDILVDLTGHTGKNRMLMFALKPAPVQVSYLGYPNTTGLEAIDYRLTDNLADPAGKTDHFFSESLVRLPRCFLCFRNLTDSPEVTVLPALKSNIVTFGSFNTGMKINDQVIDLWSQILLSIPHSRLILKAKHFGDKEIVAEWQKKFTKMGIDSDTLELVGYINSAYDHLQFYNTIDICLDTFPYNGTTTTCEALWMGVPVISLTGDRHSSRVGASILHTVGLTDWATGSQDEYLKKAVTMAASLEELAAIRSSLRQRLHSSSLMDEPGFTKNLETIYVQMYQAYLSGRVL